LRIIEAQSGGLVDPYVRCSAFHRMLARPSWPRDANPAWTRHYRPKNKGPAFAGPFASRITVIDYQITTRLSSARTIASPALHWNAAA
jgi:hypothetical protein